MPTTSLGTVEPTHPCARCGAPVGQGIGLCERCNPLGLRDVAASQVHGSVFIAVAAAIIALAFVARLAVAGAGPFTGSVDAVTATAAGLSVTVTVRNEGEAAGQTTCRVGDPGSTGNSVAFLLSPRLEGGESATFARTVTELGTTERPLTIACRTP